MASKRILISKTVVIISHGAEDTHRTKMCDKNSTKSRRGKGNLSSKGSYLGSTKNTNL
jgi:hypothetical protein